MIFVSVLIPPVYPTSKDGRNQQAPVWDGVFQRRLPLHHASLGGRLSEGLHKDLEGLGSRQLQVLLNDLHGEMMNKYMSMSMIPWWVFSRIQSIASNDSSWIITHFSITAFNLDKTIFILLSYDVRKERDQHNPSRWVRKNHGEKSVGIFCVLKRNLN